MHRKLGLIGILLGLSVAVAPTSAWAQAQSGSIFVKAVDEQGAAVPGATLTVTSPVLPQPLIGVTDSTGIYRFPTLSVGTYSVKINLAGFQTITREGVAVVQSQTVTIDFALKVSAMAEEITVKGETPVVDTKSATVATNLDSKLLESTPGGKDIWNILEYKVPGLIFDVPDVGGNQAGLQRGFSARGTPNGQNVQLLNGVNVGDPAAIGFAMNYYDPSSFENIQVSSGAQDISMGTSGVTVNMVTKSGTNAFAGQFLQTYQGAGTQWDNIDDTLKKAGFRPDANAVAYITNTNGQAGGPMLRNKLFYFGSLNHQPTHVNVPGFPALPPANVPTLLADTSDQDTTDITTGTGRLTYQLNGGNRFDIYGSKQRYDKPNRGANATTTQDSNSKEYDIDNVAQVLWNWVLTDRLFANTNLSYNNVHFPLSQKTTLQPLSDNSTGILLRNRQSTANMFRRRLEVNSNWQYFVPSFIGGRHEIKGGVSHGYTPEDVTTTRVDNVNLTFRSQQGTASQPPGPVNVTIFNSPTVVKRAVTNTALYVQDSFAIGRLTAIAGIRWERVEGFIPPQTHASSDYFPSGTVIGGLNVTLQTGGVLTSYAVPDTFARVDNAPLWKNWAPRFSGTYDLTGKGRSVVKVSWGKYLDQIGTGTPGPNPCCNVSQTYAWVDGNSDLVFQRGNATWDGFKYVGGEFGALQSTSIPNPNPFDPTLERTWRYETTVGLDHELFAGVRGSATFIHRREKNAQGTVDQSLELWPSQFTLINVPEPGPDGVFGTSDDATLDVYNRNPGVTQVTKTVNDNRLGTTYKGLELVVTKRYANGFALLGGYTFSHTTVELTSLSNPNNAFVNAQGEQGGRRHLFKATGSYILPYQITVGANLRMQSGLPITRTYTVPGCSATVLTNCLNQGGTGVNAEPRGSSRLPGIYTIDTRVGRFFNLGRQRIELSMDAYNLANANTIYDVRTGTGTTAVRDFTQPGNPPPTITVPTFMSPTGALGPRILRFNVTYWFK